MKRSRSIKPRRSGKKAPKKLAGIERVLSGDTLVASALGQALKKLVAETMRAEMEPYVERLEALFKDSAGMREEGIVVRGNLRYRPGFEDVWVNGTHYDLRERSKARLCLQYLVEKKAFDTNSARRLVDEIDPYVREKGDFPRLASIKIDDYFNDRAGKLQILRRELIASVRGDGRYFLKVD